MMKSKACITISLILLLTAVKSPACGPYYYAPGEYFMYRVSEDYLPYWRESRNSITSSDFDWQQNCALWRNEAGVEISIEDVRSLVYHASLADLRALSKASSPSANPFGAWLQKDREAMDFLLLAKECETVREEISSPWYYPKKRGGEDEASIALENISARALAYKGRRFRDRYLLQAERALMSLRRYDDCINVWNAAEQAGIPEGLIKRMAARYVAGAYEHIGDADKARQIYGQAGDIVSLLMLVPPAEEDDDIEAVAAFCTDSPGLRDYIANEVKMGQWDREELSTQREEDTYVEKRRRRLLRSYDVCMRMAGRKQTVGRDFWYYTAAFIQHLLGNDKMASTLLSGAEANPSDPLIGESVRVFRIYLDAQLTPFSASYAGAMVSRLGWLDGKIVSAYREAERDCISSGIYMMKSNISFCYWNDMMRKIVLGVICPKLKAGRQASLAAAFAVMADYRLLELVGVLDDGYYDRDWTYHTQRRTLEEYRLESRFNDYDYSNESFALVNAIDPDDLVRFVRMLEHPSGTVERFLAARGGGDALFYREVLGTKLLREMRYSEATEYLASVPVSYQKRLNLDKEGYFRYDPFSVTRKAAEYCGDYKLSFARRMAALEEQIKKERDPDRKALAMFRYATGLRNSGGICWPLTQYGKRYDDDAQTYERDARLYGPPSAPEPKSDFLKSQERLGMRAAELFVQALSMAQDPEVLARMHYELKNLRTIMTDFEGTKAWRELKGGCDTYRDYHMEAADSTGRSLIWN